MDTKTKILLVEDSAFDARIVKDIFNEPALKDFILFQVPNLSEAFSFLKQQTCQLILLDLTLPDGIGLDTFLKVQKAQPLIPIVVLTRVADENLALEALDAGAQDYLVKGAVDAQTLKRSIRYAIERKRLLEQLRLYAEKLEQQVNQRTEQLQQTISQLEIEINKRNATEQQLRKVIEELKTTQSQLIQAEKMETIGRLASGIAHEVKNPLAIILQATEYLEKKIPIYEKDITVVLNDLKEATMRADAIIKGVLDFSSISKLDNQPVQINQPIDKALLLLKHQLDKFHINVEKDIPIDLPLTLIDVNKMTQVFINLFENSIHAMPEGGRLEIKVRLIKAEKLTSHLIGLRRQDYFRPQDEVLVITVEDSGCGIPEQNLSKVFDPFFTTKRNQGGTGLGLAVVNNIIASHKGLISIRNKPIEQGKGVIVEIALKVHQKEVYDEGQKKDSNS
ncbi:MAG: ATP-binding protein [Candidatus Omnitrophica bacterium]|nr:ATP-binding protein [Candidatus Omnitrophota bacterium]